MTSQEALKLLTAIRNVDPEMPVAQAMCLFVIAQEEEGLSLTELSKKVGIGMATASRYVASLNNMTRYRTEGLKFVESFENPLERRKKIIRLTTRGKIAVRKILGEENANIQTR